MKNNKLFVLCLVLAGFSLNASESLAQSCNVTTPADKICCCKRTEAGVVCAVQTPVEGKCEDAAVRPLNNENGVCPCTIQRSDNENRRR